MNGKTALVTGATGGIGFHAAAALARKGARVFVTGRDETRGRQAVDELRRHAGHDRVELVLSDATLIRANLDLAREIARRTDRLDVLVNNAGGAVSAARRETHERIEMSLALNFAGPFALTQQLLPLLAAVPDSRIVNVVSSAYAMWKRDPLEDPQSLQHYAGLEAHAHAKLLNILFTLALARRLEGRQLVNAVNPGMAWTPGTAALTPDAVPHWRFIWPVVRWVQRRASAEGAALGIIELAAAPMAGPTGRYFDGRKEERLPDPLSDIELQERVWRLGEALAARAVESRFAAQRTAVSP